MDRLQHCKFIKETTNLSQGHQHSSIANGPNSWSHLADDRNSRMQSLINTQITTTLQAETLITEA